jgi:hypothetical protein
VAADATACLQSTRAGLYLDERAQRVLAQAVALTVTFLPNGRTILPRLAVQWRRAMALQRGGALIPVARLNGVAFYAERRVAAYSTLAPLVLTGWMLWR